MGRIPSLDGIRAVSFMWVFAAHADLGNLIPGDLVRGDFGVTIFFFLSGFIITTLLRSEFEKHGSVNLVHFWLRRALRILPPLFVVVLASVLMTLLLYPPGTMRPSAVAAELLFYSNYWGIYHVPDNEPRGMEVVWSLAVEEHFYLLFPLLFVGMQKWRISPQRQALLLWGLCAAILVWRCVLVMAMHATLPRIYFATDTRVDSVLFGCALAVWHNPVLDKPTRVSDRRLYALLPVSLLVLVACLLYRDPVFMKTWYFSLQGAALTLLFTGAVRYHSAPPFRFPNYRPVAYIGVLSYSLYLVHNVLWDAAWQLWPHSHYWQRIVIAMAGSLLAAWVIYAAVEQPCARLRAALTHQGFDARGNLTRVAPRVVRAPVD